MKTTKTIKSFLILTFTTLLFSCGQTEIKDKDTVTDGNISTTISTDINKLGKLIDLNKYKPTLVKYKYVFIDNSGQDQRPSVPGPSDSHLEAVLYFDNETFCRLIADNAKLSTISTGRKEAYQFDWLDYDVKTELSKMDSFSDFTPTFFNTVGHMHGGCFMLNNKILLRLYTN